MWIKAKWGKTRIPQPLEVENRRKGEYVSIGECNRRMCEQGERLSRIEDEVKGSNGAVLAKLDDLDRRSEERAIALNRRIDPLISEIGAVRGKVELMEKRQ